MRAGGTATVPSTERSKASAEASERALGVHKVAKVISL